MASPEPGVGRARPAVKIRIGDANVMYVVESYKFLHLFFNWLPILPTSIVATKNDYSSQMPSMVAAMGVSLRVGTMSSTKSMAVGSKGIAESSASLFRKEG